MSKDHTPSGFDRPSGYQSDLEVAETGPMVKSVNTSFGSKNHNAYIMRTDKTHEHFFYDPLTQKSGWHGSNYETHNNHPQLPASTHVQSNGGKNMARSNPFIESLKVDQATMDRCNDVSRNAAKNANTQGRNTAADDGGRERGDNGPGSLGRESGNKSGENANGHTGANDGHGTSGACVSGQGADGHGAEGGQSSGGHSSGGHGSGGHGK